MPLFVLSLTSQQCLLKLEVEGSLAVRVLGARSTLPSFGKIRVNFELGRGVVVNELFSI